MAAPFFSKQHSAAKVVLKDRAALHHEFHALQLCTVAKPGGRKKASRSLRAAGLDFPLSEGTHPTPIVIPASVLWLTQKNQTKSVSRLRIRAPDRPPAPLFHSRHPAPRRQDPRILAGRHTSDSRFPALLDEVEGRQAQANGNKSQGEQGEGRQQLADKVKLKRGDTPQKPPDPLAKAIFGVHGF